MISVCLASCNGTLFIKDQVLSVLSQLSSDDELIIADDASDDDTLEVVNRIADNRIVVLAAKSQRLGVVKNFERALMHAKGNFIFLCDQDDIWEPGKVNASLTALESSILVVTDCKVVNSELKEIHSSFFEQRHSKPGILHNLLRNSYIGCCMAFRKELLQYVLPIPKYSPMHDMWIGLVAETQGKITFLPKALLLYRRHHSNASHTAGKSKFSIYMKVKIRALLFGLLFLRVLRNLFS